MHTEHVDEQLRWSVHYRRSFLTNMRGPPYILCSMVYYYLTFIWTTMRGPPYILCSMIYYYLTFIWTTIRGPSYILCSMVYYYLTFIWTTIRGPPYILCFMVYYYLTRISLHITMLRRSQYAQRMVSLLFTLIDRDTCRFRGYSLI